VDYYALLHCLKSLAAEQREKRQRNEWVPASSKQNEVRDDEASAGEDHLRVFLDNPLYIIEWMSKKRKPYGH
jgi:hypothetical protein